MATSHLDITVAAPGGSTGYLPQEKSSLHPQASIFHTPQDFKPREEALIPAFPAQQKTQDMRVLQWYYQYHRSSDKSIKN